MNFSFISDIFFQSIFNLSSARFIYRIIMDFQIFFLLFDYKKEIQNSSIQTQIVRQCRKLFTCMCATVVDSIECVDDDEQYVNELYICICASDTFLCYEFQCDPIFFSLITSRDVHSEFLGKMIRKKLIRFDPVQSMAVCCCCC